eukprot:scaffold108107_cov28-Tisochrysis_lutea.AAC.1
MACEGDDDVTPEIRREERRRGPRVTWGEGVRCWRARGIEAGGGGGVEPVEREPMPPRRDAGWTEFQRIFLPHYVINVAGWTETLSRGEKGIARSEREGAARRLLRRGGWAVRKRPTEHLMESKDFALDTLGIGEERSGEPTGRESGRA